MTKNLSFHLVVALISAILTGGVCVLGQEIKPRVMTEEEILKQSQSSPPLKGEIYYNGNHYCPVKIVKLVCKLLRT